MRKSTEIKRNDTYRYSSEEGKVSFYTENIVSTYEDGSILNEDRYIREDHREYTNINKSYTEFKNIDSFNSAIRRMIREGFVKIN